MKRSLLDYHHHNTKHRFTRISSSMVGCMGHRLIGLRDIQSGNVFIGGLLPRARLTCENGKAGLHVMYYSDARSWHPF